MKLKVVEILNSAPVIQQVNSSKLPIAMSLRMVKNNKALQEVVDEFEKRRVEIVKSLSDDKGGIPENKTSEFNEQIEKVASEEVEVEISTFKIEELSDLEISPNDLSVISWLIAE